MSPLAIWVSPSSVHVMYSSMSASSLLLVSRFSWCARKRRAALRLNLLGTVLVVRLVLSVAWELNPGPFSLVFDLETVWVGVSAEKAGKCEYTLLSLM